MPARFPPSSRDGDHVGPDHRHHVDRDAELACFLEQDQTKELFVGITGNVDVVHLEAVGIGTGRQRGLGRLHVVAKHRQILLVPRLEGGGQGTFHDRAASGDGFQGGLIVDTRGRAPCAR